MKPMYLIYALSALLVLSLLGNAAFWWKFVHHGGAARVHTLLHAHLETQTPGKDLRVVFIGNSITLHPLADYWWGEWGMAASDAEHDYVHRTVAGLAENRHVIADAMNFAAWETLAHDRAELLPLVEQFLAKDVDLYVVQLGENAGDIQTMDGDFQELLRALHAHSPQAKVIVLGGFWKNDKLDAIKEKTCAETGDTYVDLKDIQTEAYQASLGTVVKDAQGGTHTNEHAGVAKHPGDRGMEEMARRILAVAKD